MAAVQVQGSVGSGDASYSWILEHLLTYPGTYEIPLRTMYTLNSTTQTQQPPTAAAKAAMTGNAFPSRSANSEDQQILDTQTAAAQLRANLISHISQQPSQPSSLPPAFVTSFVRRVFPVELESVDFPQALTALDYLKDLEVRRRREVVAALNRLGVDKSDFNQKEKLGKKYPGVLKWIIDIEEKERTVEALYTQVYLGLRRWTLVNEMSLEPFVKSNCLAMLNTLYPPVNTVQPTAQLTSQVLTAQRNGFFRYIQNVEKNGPALLKTLIDQGKARDHETGWTNVRATVDRYLRAANAIIDECHEITGHESLSNSASTPTEKEFEDHRSRKVDSGISFTSSKTSNTNRTSTSTTGSNKSKEAESSEKPSGSTLERIAREIRRIRSRGDISDAARQSRRRDKSRTRSDDRIEIHEAIPPMPTQSEKSIRAKPSLRTMKSYGALSERDRNLSISN